MEKKKLFEVTMEIEADTFDEADAIIEKMFKPLTDSEVCQIHEGKLKDTDEPHFQERIRYVADWHGEGEHYVFEGKWTNDNTGWGLDTAFKLFDLNGEKGVLISYTALTKIRELMKSGVEFFFSNAESYNE